MGGGQTLNIWISNPDKFGYIGVFSSGIFGIAGGGRPGAVAPPTPSFEEQHQQTLDDTATKKDLKLIWFAIGKEDRGLENSHRTADLLKKHGFDVAFQESSGGHIWINWRNYLNEFAPLLFQVASPAPPSRRLDDGASSATLKRACLPPPAPAERSLGSYKLLAQRSDHCFAILSRHWSEKPEIAGQ